jgi:ABC-type sugar transport system ATPase subunit
MRVLAGFFDDYEGAISIAGQLIDITTPAQARRAEIALVHQELSLLPEFTVAENIFLGREPRGLLPGSVSFSRMKRAAENALGECGVAVEPTLKVETLSIAERQLVEIVKGVAFAPRVLILDEPTSSLTIREVRELFAIVRRLAARSATVVYISHKLDKVLAITDRVTVLRDGRKVASHPTSEWTEPELVRAMVGRDLSSLFPLEAGWTTDPTLENGRPGYCSGPPFDQAHPPSRMRCFAETMVKDTATRRHVDVWHARAIARTSYFTFLDRRGRPRPPTKSDI